MEHIKWVLLRLKTYWLFILLSLLGSILEASGTAGVSLLIKSLVDKVFMLREGGQLVPLVLELMAFVLLSQLGNFSTEFFSSLYTERELKRLREEAFLRLLKADYSALSRVSAGELAGRVLSDLSLYKNLIGAYAVKLIREPFMVLFLVGVLLYRDWLLTLSLGVLTPVLILAVRYFGGKRGKHIKRAQEGQAHVADRLYSSFTGFESIRSFNAQDRFLKLFSELSALLYRASLKSQVYFALNSVFNYSFGYMVVALVIIYGGYRTAQGSLTPGDFISYITALVFLQKPLTELQKGFVEVRSSLPVIKRIRELLSLEEERSGSMELKTFNFLSVENLRVYVSGKEIIKNLSFTVRRGEKLGIMGDTGSGKSTLLKTLAGFFDYEGSVSVDGMELRDIRKESLRDHFLYLPQEPLILPGSVRANLLMAKEPASDEELLKALRLAGCDFIESLEQEVSWRGLSGGERQRLVLARVFLKPAEVLMLDEATSALDAKKEQEVLKNLFEAFKDKTFLVVAHRFSNLLLCDRVLVLRDGTLAFEGKPKEAIDFFLQSP